MPSFSPELMARLSKGVFTVRSYEGTRENVPMFHWKGNLSEFFALVRDMVADDSPGGEQARECHMNDKQGAWGGFHSQTEADYLQTSRSIDAQKAFNEALAHIDAKGKASTPEYRVTGGVWSVPRYLSGHPQCAIYRPKTAKPAKSYDVTACFSSDVKSEDVAKPLARIARAAWDYQRSGGNVSIVVHYAVWFRKACEGQQGICVSIRVPLSDVASIATALSVQTFRYPMLGIASGLTNLRGDTLKCGWIVKPGFIPIDGLGASDEKALLAAGIK